MPFGWFPVAVQTGPVAQDEIAPVWQMLPPGTQAAPTAQPTQVPPLHTWFVPQVVPSASGPVSVHTGAPVVQEMAPEWQGFASVQAAPVVHGTQAPVLLQTRFVPQLVPAGCSVAVAVQTGPVAHEVMVPTAQTFVLGVQDAPTVHPTQAPPLQTWFVPHTVPSGFAMVSVQTGAPVVGSQAMAASWHGLVETQAAPAAQAHAPALQASPVPQAVPSRTLPVSVQTGAPVPQVIAAVLQVGSVVEVQAAPAVQGEHAPLLHTRFVPQLVPFATFPLSVQLGAPVMGSQV